VNWLVSLAVSASTTNNRNGDEKRVNAKSVPNTWSDSILYCWVHSTQSLSVSCLQTGFNLSWLLLHRLWTVLKCVQQEWCCEHCLRNEIWALNSAQSNPIQSNPIQQEW